jgi:hypothetical protein
MLTIYRKYTAYQHFDAYFRLERLERAASRRELKGLTRNGRNPWRDDKLRDGGRLAGEHTLIREPSQSIIPVRPSGPSHPALLTVLLPQGGSP